MFASSAVGSNQSGILTVDGNVSVAAVEPDINRISQIPDAHGVNDRDVTSPQIYLVFYSAVIASVLPLTLITTHSPVSPLSPLSPVSPLSPLGPWIP